MKLVLTKWSWSVSTGIEALTMSTSVLLTR